MKIIVGFSPGGMLFGSSDQSQVFFRNLIKPCPFKLALFQALFDSRKVPLFFFPLLQRAAMPPIRPQQ